MAYLPIIISLVGLISQSSNNSIYPTYSNAVSFVYHSKDNGLCYEGYTKQFASEIEIEITADIYFNSYNPALGATQSFLIKNVNYEMNLYWYERNSDGTYTDLDLTSSYTMALIEYEINDTNIDTTYFSMNLSMTDVCDYIFYNPLERNGQGRYYSGNLSDIPNYEAKYDTQVEYRYVFNKNQIYSIMQNAADANYNYNLGYNDGYNTGYDTGNNEGHSQGYQEGYTQGMTDADNYNDTAVTIFSGILSVGLLPVNFFLAILNFEVFGINIGAFVSALLTIAIVVIVVRMVVNGGNGKD